MREDRGSSLRSGGVPSEKGRYPGGSLVTEVCLSGQ